MTLPDAFLRRPIAHRGLHERARGVIENSVAAFDAAMARDYGIELDVQISADGVPVVFHDPTLDRLTAATGPVNARTVDELRAIALSGSADTILPLREILGRIAGRVPVLVEIKDQTGLGGAQAIDQAVGQVIRDRPEGVAVMSFNPRHIAALDWLKGVPRGITSTDADDYPSDWPQAKRASLARLEMFESSGACFISHNHRDLQNERVRALRAAGVRVLCWTIRSQDQADTALRMADNITFEGFTPA